MRRWRILLFVVSLIASRSAQAQMELGNGKAIAFATVEEGKKILGTRDEFVERMSPFDRAARLKSDRDVSEEEYLAFASKSVLEWEDAERERLTTAFASVGNELAALDLPLPKKVFLIKTSGKEEGGAAYTRGNAIVVPRKLLREPVEGLRKLLFCHELFHVLSRADPALRERLYAAIGFVRCDEVVLPPEFSTRKITNPDAPRNDYCIRLQVTGKDRWAVPILVSNTEKYDPARGGEFFDYLQFGLLLVERGEGMSVKPLDAGGRPTLVGLRQVSGYFEQVGKNTGYIVHPEEILADNFTLLVLRDRDVPSPEILDKVEKILKQQKNP